MTDRNSGMNRIGRAALLASGLIGCLTTPAAGADDHSKVAWRSDLGSAQAEAKSRDRLLWIQFTGPWCGNCRRMERGAFVHEPVVAEASERFVPVKLRADEHEELTASLGLSVLPSTVIVRPNGEVVDKFEGYGEPAEFAEFLRATLTAEGRSPEQVAARLRAKADKSRDPGLALAGYDPVSMVQGGKLVPGRSDLAAEHDGQTFRFANEADRAAFLAKPAAFAPINGGRCPVSQVDRSARTTCPHCRERASLTQRLTNRFSSMFAARAASAPAVRSLAATDAGVADPAATRSLSERLSALLSLDAPLRR